VQALTPQRVQALENGVAAYQRLPWWKRLLGPSSEIKHHRQSLALYYEEQLLKQWREGRALSSATTLGQFSRWHRYTPTVTVWERLTGWWPRLSGFSGRLRAYRALQTSVYQHSQVALIPLSLADKSRARVEVERLFNEKPRFHPYQILGLVTPQNKPDYQASAEVIKSAYRRLILEQHPDRQVYQVPTAGPSVEDINSAYSVLSCPVKRPLWDAKFKNPSVWQALVIELRQREEVAEHIQELEQQLSDLKKNQEAQGKQLATVTQWILSQQAGQPVNTQALLQQGLFPQLQAKTLPAVSTSSGLLSQDETTEVLDLEEVENAQVFKRAYNA
jgi:hypothetical protein